MKTALYRHFDADGALLYVGISLNSIKRTMQHRCGAHWFQQIARITIQWLPTRQEAESSERQAIKAERPRHNIAHTVASVVKHVPAVAEPQGWAVHHSRTGRRDGWYTRKNVAEHMLGWWGAVFPSESFRLVPFAGVYAGGCPVLRVIEWQQWSESAPNYGAGDRYDREAA